MSSSESSLTLMALIVCFHAHCLNSRCPAFDMLTPPRCCIISIPIINLNCFNIEFNTRHCQSIVCPSTANETHPTLHFTTESSTVTTCSLFPLILLTMLGIAIVVVHPVSISAGILPTPST